MEETAEELLDRLHFFIEARGELGLSLEVLLAEEAAYLPTYLHYLPVYLCICLIDYVKVNRAKCVVQMEGRRVMP